MKKALLTVCVVMLGVVGFYLGQMSVAEATEEAAKDSHDSTTAAIPETPQAQQVSDCGSGQYKCGYGQTWTCCNSGDKCCSYTGTDNKTWYTCRLPSQRCPD